MDILNVPAKFELRSFTRSRDNSEYLKNFVQSLDTPLKVVDFGTNRKRVYDFLLVRNSNLGPILHRFGDIAVFCAPEWHHPCSTLIFGVFPLHQIAHVGWRLCPATPVDHRSRWCYEVTLENTGKMRPLDTLRIRILSIPPNKDFVY